MINNFSNRLKQIRKSKKLTQVDMAKILNISDRGYQRWEAKDPIYPSVENIIFLADYFNISVDYLLGRTDNPNINK